MLNYKFIDRALFFSEKGILVIGDLHIGYDFMLEQSGVLIPKRQVKDIIKELKEIMKKIKNNKKELKKIIFIGDIKHAFGFEHSEKVDFQEIINFLGEILPKENIILIKGNHDTIDYSFEGKMKKFHIEGDILFIHGHEKSKETLSDKINTVVFGHLHPAVMLAEKPGIKKEIYKCFLTGKFKGKNIIVVPSFLEFTEGTLVNEYKEDYWEDFSIVSHKDIMNFNVHIVGKDEVYDFGKVKDLN